MLRILQGICTTCGSFIKQLLSHAKVCGQVGGRLRRCSHCDTFQPTKFNSNLTKHARREHKGALFTHCHQLVTDDPNAVAVEVVTDEKIEVNAKEDWRELSEC